MISFWRVFVANKGGQPGNKNAEKYNEEFALKLGNDLIEWLKVLPSNILFEEFFYFKFDGNLHPNNISKLSQKFDSFSHLIKRAKKMQEIKLQKYAGSAILNSSMAIFCLKNHHNFRDKFEHIEKKEVDLFQDGEPIKSLPPEKLIELEQTLETQLGIMKGYSVSIKKSDEKKAHLKNAVSNRKSNKKRSKKGKTTTRKKKAS